jgi:hypothetical protein
LRLLDGTFDNTLRRVCKATPIDAIENEEQNGVTILEEVAQKAALVEE